MDLFIKVLLRGLRLAIVGPQTGIWVCEWTPFTLWPFIGFGADGIGMEAIEDLAWLFSELPEVTAGNGSTEIGCADCVWAHSNSGLTLALIDCWAVCFHVLHCSGVANGGGEQLKLGFSLLICIIETLQSCIRSVSDAVSGTATLALGAETHWQDTTWWSNYKYQWSN